MNNQDLMDANLSLIEISVLKYSFKIVFIVVKSWLLASNVWNQTGFFLPSRKELVVTTSNEVILMATLKKTYRKNISKTSELTRRLDCNNSSWGRAKRTS